MNAQRDIPRGEILRLAPRIELILQTRLDDEPRKIHGADAPHARIYTGDARQQEVCVREVEGLGEEERGCGHGGVDFAFAGDYVAYLAIAGAAD